MRQNVNSHQPEAAAAASIRKPAALLKNKVILRWPQPTCNVNVHRVGSIPIKKGNIQCV